MRVDAGALYGETLPDCSCDACDETAESEAGRLEGVLLGIAAGGLQEHYPVGRRRWQHIRLRTPDGSSSGSSGSPDPGLSKDRLHEAAETIARLDDGRWPAWTLRSRESGDAG